MLTFIFELLTQSIPETLAVSFSVAVFLKVKLEKKPILLIGLIQGFIIHFLRKLPMTFGFHTIISIFILTIILYYVYDKSSLNCFISVLKTFILLTVLEVLFSYLIILLTQINVNIINQKPLLKTIVMLPHIIFLFIIGFFINKRQNKKGDEA